MPLAQPPKPNAQSQTRASTDKTTFHRSDLSPQTHCRPEDINRCGGIVSRRAHTHTTRRRRPRRGFSTSSSDENEKLLIYGFFASPPEPLRLSEFQALKRRVPFKVLGFG